MAGGHGEINWWVLGSMITNAALFFGFLAMKLKPHVSNGLIARRENMAKQLEEARAKQAEAERRLDEYKTKLDNLEAEVARIVKSYEAEADADRRRLAEDADRAIQRFVRETEFTISQEVKKAEKAIRDAAVASTLEAAEQLLTTKITPDDRRRLADEYIQQLEEVA
jgi:F-type H+-transporting ATPase subunit b